MTAIMSGVIVRPVELGDYDQWAKHWQSYQDFYEVSLHPKVTETTWNRFFDEGEPLYCGVAVKAGQVLGFVNIVYHRSTWGQNDFCYLEDLYVSPEARGQKIGKRLIEYVWENARVQKCDRLYWHTQEKNKTAQRLYDWVAEKPGVIEYRMPLKLDK